MAMVLNVNPYRAVAVFGGYVRYPLSFYLLIIVLLLRRRHVRAVFAGEGLPAELEGPSGRRDEDEGWGQSRPAENPEDDWRST